jgi:hypothetical protein
MRTRRPHHCYFLDSPGQMDQMQIQVSGSSPFGSFLILYFFFRWFRSSWRVKTNPCFFPPLMTASQPFLILDLRFLSLCKKFTKATTSFLVFADADLLVLALFVGKISSLYIEARHLSSTVVQVTRKVKSRMDPGLVALPSKVSLTSPI